VNGSVSATTFVGDGSAPTGVGKITTVTAGSGLTGGGSAGSVSLTIDSTVARTNASNTFTANQTVDGSGTANSDPGIFYFWGREVETALTISPSHHRRAMAATLGVAERISLERHAGEPKERADSHSCGLNARAAATARPGRYRLRSHPGY